MTTSLMDKNAPKAALRAARPRARGLDLEAAATASSDFDWMALVGGGIKYGVGGVVTAGATYVLSWALDSIFGLEVGKPGRVEQKQQIIDALGEIDDELSAMNAALIAISTELKNLSNQMSLEFQETLGAIDNSNALEGVSAIESMWQSLQTAVGDAMTQNPEDPTVPAGTSSNLAAAFLNPANGAQYQVDLISNSLLNVGSNVGLIDAWTNALILQIQSGADVYNSYLWLEQTTLQYVHYLYFGYSLAVAAEIRNAWVDDPADPAANKTQAQNVGLGYLERTVQPNLEKITQLFVQSVHRIILSQYALANSSSTGFKPFLGQSTLDKILSRANLLAWLINRTMDSPVNPGIVVTTYLRPSLATPTPPSLCPSGAYQPSTGTIFKIGADFSGRWFKVIDNVDGDNSQLRDFNDSDIVIVNYQWTDPVPAVGKAIGGPGVFASLTPANVSMSTLAIASSASSDTVVYGYRTDASAITQNMIWNSGWQLQGAPAKSENDDHENFALSYTPTFNGPDSSVQRSLAGALYVRANYDGTKGEQDFESFVICPLTYRGSSNATLRVYVSASLALSASRGDAPAGYSPVPVRAAGFFELPKTHQISGYYYVDEPDDSGPPATSNASQGPGIVTLTVTPNQYVTPTFVVLCVAGDEDGWKDYDGRKDDGKYNESDAFATWTINGLEIAWPQPTVS